MIEAGMMTSRANSRAVCWSTPAGLRDGEVGIRQQREILGLESDESSYVFCHADGSPFYPNTVSQRFSLLVKKAGVPYLRLHDLRHTHAT